MGTGSIDTLPAELVSSILPLDAVLLRGELSRRPVRSPNVHDENAAFLALSQGLDGSPHAFLQILMDTTLELCDAGTAGISLLEPTDDGVEQFRWTALAGRLAPAVNGTTPRNFSPCGVCLDHDGPVHFSFPERRFTYFFETGVPFVEGLVLPFYVDGLAAGTIWIVTHDASRRFDLEDVRIMTRLATFAGAAYGLLRRQTPS
jgi:hypothetical protein